MKKTYLIGFLAAAFTLAGCATQPQPLTEPEQSTAPTPAAAQITDLQKQLTDKNARIDVLNAKLADMRKQNADLSGLAKSSADDQAVIAELSKEKAALQDQVGSLQKEAASLRTAENAAARNLQNRIARLSKEFAPEIAKGEMALKQYRDVLVLSVQNSVFFVPDWPTLLPGGRKILHRLAPILKEDPSLVVRVEGNTATAESSPASLKLYPTSWHLGAARAANVVEYLQRDDGVNPKQLVASSLGRYHPIADNKTAVGREKNRRVDFVLVPRDLWDLQGLKTIDQGPAAK